MRHEDEGVRSRIESYLTYFELLVYGAELGKQLEPCDMLLRVQTLETNLVFLYYTLYDAIPLVERLTTTLQMSLREWKAALTRLQPLYEYIEETMFSRRALLADYAMYREQFLAFLRHYQQESPISEGDVYTLSNNLSVRSILEILLRYLYVDNAAVIRRESAILDTALRMHTPHAFVETLIGSWHDPAYQRMELVPRSHWWRYREGYYGEAQQPG